MLSGKRWTLLVLVGIARVCRSSLRQAPHSHCFVAVEVPSGPGEHRPHPGSQNRFAANTLICSYLWSATWILYSKAAAILPPFRSRTWLRLVTSSTTI